MSRPVPAPSSAWAIVLPASAVSAAGIHLLEILARPGLGIPPLAGLSPRHLPLVVASGLGLVVYAGLRRSALALLWLPVLAVLGWNLGTDGALMLRPWMVAWLPAVLGDPARYLLPGELIQVVAVVAVAAGWGVLVLRAAHPAVSSRENAHGTARWARRRDLERARLLGPSGLPLGFTKSSPRQLLRDASTDHALVVLPSGAGKTTAIVLLHLLTGARSAVALDPKGELFERSAGYRTSLGHLCYSFDPSHPDTVRINPLQILRRGPEEIEQADALSLNLITLPHGSEKHWARRARQLFKCLLLHVLYTGEGTPTVAAVRALAQRQDLHPAFLKKIAAYPHDPELGRRWTLPDGRLTATHPELVSLAGGFAGIPAKEFGSISSTLQSFLDPWGDSRLSRATAVSDLRFEDFLRAPGPSVLYVNLSFLDLERLAPFVRLLIAGFTYTILEKIEPESGSLELDLLLDEFGNYGNVPAMGPLLSYLRAYGVRLQLFIQSYNQLTHLYGPNETISNTPIQIGGATTCEKTRDRLSKLTGTSTHIWQRRGTSVRSALSRGGGTTVSRSPAEAARPLLTLGEVGALDRRELLVLRTGLPPVRVEKAFYFEDPILVRRAAIPPPPHRPGAPP